MRIHTGGTKMADIRNAYGNVICRVEGSAFYDHNGKQVGRLEGDKFYDNYGNWKYTISGDYLMDTYGNRVKDLTLPL
jgi:hypothetical protein